MSATSSRGCIRMPLSLHIESEIMDIRYRAQSCRSTCVVQLVGYEITICTKKMIPSEYGASLAHFYDHAVSCTYPVILTGTHSIRSAYVYVD